MRRVCLIALLLTGLAMALPGEELRVGESLPVLSGVDQNERPRSFHDLKGPEGLVVVVFRSADW